MQAEPEPMSFEPANTVCLCSRYTLLEKVGAGRAGEVWLARDHDRGTEVALKILDVEHAHDAATWQSLQHEFFVASRLNHPFVLKAYPPQRDGDAVFLPMEYAPGASAERLRRLSYLEIVPVLIEVAQALSHMHACGFVHGDLKPANVLFGADGHVRLADFGVASQVRDSPVRTGFSPLTASPEQLRGEAPSIADDVYGLGALACELLTGRAPYYLQIDRARGLEDPVLRIQPARPAPDRLIALIGSMLRKQARRRPRGMPEVIERLESSLSDTLTFDAQPGPSQLPGGGEAVRAGGWNSPVDRVVPTERADSAARAVEAEPPGEPRAAGPAAQRAQGPRSKPQPTDAPRTEIRQSAMPRTQPPRTQTPRVETPRFEVPRPTEAQRAVHTDSFAAPERGPSTMRAELEAFGFNRDLRGLPPGLHARRPVRDPRPRRRHISHGFLAIVVIAAASATGLILVPQGPMRVRAWVNTALASLKLGETQHAVSEAPRDSLAVSDSGGVLAERTSEPSAPAASGSGSGRASTNEADFRTARSRLDAQLKALEKRGASEWAGKAYAAVRTLEAEAVGANEAGNAALALEKLNDAEARLAGVKRVAATVKAPGHRAKGHDEVLRTLVEGLNAEVEHDSRLAARDFRRVLALDPHNAVALAGLQRARTRLNADARPAQRPRVVAAQPLDSATVQTPARPPTLPAHASAKAELAYRMRALVAQPTELDSKPIRREAEALVREERAIPNPDASLQALAMKLSSLVASYGKTVHVALVSDDQTQVEITQIGSFGTFMRRNLDLRPGVYTVVGTRSGYKTVRLEVTVRPGVGVQKIRVRCDEPI